MITRLIELCLPGWAGNRLLRFDLSRRTGEATGRAYAGQVAVLLLLLLVAAIVYSAVSGAAANAPNASNHIWQSLYFPALSLQLITLIAALSLGAASIDTERSRNTWDNLRATELGAGMALRARWLGILVRLRAPITAILLVRLILALGTLIEVAAFGGNYLKMLGASALPPLADWQLGLFLIALNLTLNILLPPIMIASAAALGIFVSAIVTERLFSAVLLLLLIVFQVAFIAVSGLVLAQVVFAETTMTEGAAFFLLLGFSAYGDWGLYLAQLGNLGELWQRVPGGAFTSLALALVVLCHVALLDGMMVLADRVVERRG